MIENHPCWKNVAKICVYVLFIVAIFTFSLLTMPYEYFFVSAIVVLVALRGVEKELRHIDLKQFQLFRNGS